MQQVIVYCHLAKEGEVVYSPAFLANTQSLYGWVYFIGGGRERASLIIDFFDLRLRKVILFLS
jgi:hypothetical protein